MQRENYLKINQKHYSQAATAMLKNVKTNLGHRAKSAACKFKLENVGGSSRVLDEQEFGVEQLIRRI